MAGDVFQDRKDARIAQAVGHGAGVQRHLPRLVAIKTVAQHRMCVCLGNIGQRSAIGINPAIQKLAANDIAAQIQRARGIRAERLDHIQGRRPFAPIGRAHPLHPSAFLVDEDGRIGRGRAQVADQAGQLQRFFDIAREEDEAHGLHIPEKRVFLTRQFGPGTAQDGGREPHISAG